PAAAVTLLPLPRPLMTGEVLDAAYRLFRAGLLRTLPYSGIAVLVLELPTLYSALFGGSSFVAGGALGGGFQEQIVRAAAPSDSTLVFVCALLLSVLMFGV